jgi:hypothetical protein
MLYTIIRFSSRDFVLYTVEELFFFSFFELFYIHRVQENQQIFNLSFASNCLLSRYIRLFIEACLRYSPLYYAKLDLTKVEYIQHHSS